MARSLAIAVVALSCVVAAQGMSSEREVTFAGAGGLPLRGTLLLPDGAAGRVPGVLLLAGSGPTDRNGNQPPVVVPDLLKQIGERLAQEGYASLRFDKRAVRTYAAAWPKDTAAQNDFFSWDAFVNDAKAALAFLQSQPEVDGNKTLVAGHSEGSMIAMQIGHDLGSQAGGPAGLLLISAPGRQGGEILREQVAASLRRAAVTDEAARPYSDYVDLALNQIAKDGTVPANPPTGLGGLFPRNATKLLRVEMSFDPAAVLPAYPGPVLVLQGERDIQVSATRDFPLVVAALKARARGAVDALVVPAASHNLKAVGNENVERGVTGPIVPAALDAIASWLRRTLPLR